MATPVGWMEANVKIGGKDLTLAQALALRVGVGLLILEHHETNDDIFKLYVERWREIEEMLHASIKEKREG